MNITSIATSLMGFASGGWGAFAAIIALMVGAFILYRKYVAWKQEKAENETKNKAAEDQTAVIKDNQAAGTQLEKDAAANEAAKEKAIKELVGGEPLA